MCISIIYNLFMFEDIVFLSHYGLCSQCPCPFLHLLLLFQVKFSFRPLQYILIFYFSFIILWTRFGCLSILVVLILMNCQFPYFFQNSCRFLSQFYYIESLDNSFLHCRITLYCILISPCKTSWSITHY